MNTSKSRKSKAKKSAVAVQGKKPTNKTEAAKLAAIIEELRPALASHGGDIELVSFKGGTVSLRFMGACGSCQYANGTLMQIMKLIREKVKTAKRIRLI